MQLWYFCFPWEKNVSHSFTEIISPITHQITYNVYIHSGFMPNPILTPTQIAMQEMIYEISRAIILLNIIDLPTSIFGWILAGQHDDARMSISLAITAVRHGAYCLNYTRVESLLKTVVDGQERVCGARVRNTLTGKIFYIFKIICVIDKV